ncbi:unnamed protein product [Microthlaspi erraticum]|uniref:Knottin scorpion toxin-like domain-containing protein n=1 Tax=Microthlaspi erraticum TaxID=1685480 RepID=A0A6D2KR25_9BRAS|nr:unnamed protein product [Microthlaspi erraticum]
MASKAISFFILSVMIPYNRVWMVSLPTAKAQSAKTFAPCKTAKECDAANCASGEALCIREKCHCIGSSNHLNILKIMDDFKPRKVKLKGGSDSLIRLKYAS